MGCAIPVWIVVASLSSQSSHLDKVLLVSVHFGWITVGIGDSMAAVIGSNFGKLRWLQNCSKSVLGSLSSGASMIIACEPYYVIVHHRL